MLAEQTTIWLQLGTMVATLLLALGLAALRDRRVPADDIGLAFLLALVAYNVLPPLAWLLQDGYYTSQLSGRLLHLRPDADEVVQLLAIALGYAFGFAAVYCSLRLAVPRPVPGDAWGRVPDGAVLFALALLVLATALALGVKLIALSQGAQTYADQYRVIAQLPIALRQFYKITSGFAAVSQLVLLVAILQRGPAYRRWLLVYVGLLLLSFDPGGSRSALVLGLATILLAWHVLVRPVRLPAWLAVGGTGLVLFTLFGTLRTIGGWDNIALLQTSDLLTLGEFEALYANGVELLRAGRHAAIDVAWSVRFNELFAFLPSQLLPFEKLSLDQWYLEAYHPAYRDAGGGWAFGAVAQALIGGGIAEAVLRGALLGAIALLLLSALRRHCRRWWVLPLYLYLLAGSYLAVRASTFAQLAELVQVALPCLLLIGVAGRLVQQTVRGTTRPVAPP